MTRPVVADPISEEWVYQHSCGYLVTGLSLLLVKTDRCGRCGEVGQYHRWKRLEDLGV